MTTAATDRPAQAGLPAAERYLNRELSWLDFNARVLDLAEREDVPLLERVKFLAIFSSNLDEFFQVRVAGVKDQLVAGLRVSGIDGRSPTTALRAIRRRAAELVDRQSDIFARMCQDLTRAGITIAEWSALDENDRADLGKTFEEQIYPVLTPLAVDPGHPFPYISNLSLNLAVLVADPISQERRFARVKVPPLLPRFVPLADGERFVPLEQVIAARLDVLFPGMEIVEHHPFRVTRDADLELAEGEADDLLAAVEIELRRRRFGEAVRLEVAAECTPEVQALLVRELDLEAEDVYQVRGLLDLAGLIAVYDLDQPDLKDEPWPSSTQDDLASADDDPVDLFAVLRQRDVLVHHPYDSFTTSVEAFVGQAADDPKVLAIKHTLYRTSGDSPIVKALIRAAESGKQVAVLVELKARFDEQANIAWAKALEQVGVHVVYGLVGLKTHSKTALIVRNEEDGLRRYCHVGTGNYNPKTARMYEDVGLLTSDAELGADLSDLFNLLTGYSRRSEYRKILPAPTSLRKRIISFIEAEAEHPDGRIVMKMNSLSDPAVIDALYAASQKGCRVDLIVRGICCLRPGVEGLSETITVRSIVGRYLEHSRIFWFEHGGDAGDGSVYIGSADMMPRNLDGRIEVVVPVSAPPLRLRLTEVLDTALSDDTNAWSLQPDGTWQRVETVLGVSSQRALYEQARERARRRRTDVGAADELGRVS